MTTWTPNDTLAVAHALVAVILATLAYLQGRKDGERRRKFGDYEQGWMDCYRAVTDQEIAPMKGHQR